MTDSVLLSVSDKTAVITLNKPEKRNALNGEMIEQLIQVLQNITQDPVSQLVVLKGSGVHFCAGADLHWMQQTESAAKLSNLLKMLYSFPKPVLVLVQGNTYGGGIGLLACCDIAIAAENSEFCFSEVKLGLTPSLISPYILAAIGERAAKYLFLTAEKFNAAKAHELGLVHEITDDLSLAGENRIRSLLKNSPNALLEVKKLVAGIRSNTISKEMIQLTETHIAAVRHSKEAQEGMTAFLEKRTPRW